jgi:hypothetical protein
MFKQTIRFERAQDALVFDNHMLEFLRTCERGGEEDDACVFTTRLQDEDAHIRVVQTDSAQMLGRLLNYLTVRNFPPATRAEPLRGALSN